MVSSVTVLPQSWKVRGPSVGAEGCVPTRGLLWVDTVETGLSRVALAGHVSQRFRDPAPTLN